MISKWGGGAKIILIEIQYNIIYDKKYGKSKKR